MHIYSSVAVVSDQDTALDFYVNKLGGQVRQDNQMTPDYRLLAVAPSIPKSTSPVTTCARTSR